MRPLKLIVTGFGTYCKRTEIDLEKLGKSGLFLIAGDTGSGKTTIFDAITYALFGDLNGQNRNAAMIRSTFATPDIPTEVDLTFEFKDKIYNVKRNPEYQRTAKRGDGLTTQIAEATLTMPDGSVITQQSKVTAAIVDLLRINKEQFSQIVMIAQGDFQKLLMESTEHRMDIFRNLFKTDYYLKLQNKLLDEEKTLSAECKTIRNEMSIYLNSVQCDSENTISLQLEKAQKNEIPINEAAEVIEKIISEDEELHEKLETELKDIEVELLKNAEVLGLAKNLETTAKELELKKGVIISEKNKNQMLKDEFENQKEKTPEREQKEKEYAVLNNELSNYDELSEIESKLKETVMQVSETEKLLLKTEEGETKLQNEKKALEEELKSLKDGGNKLLGLQTEIERLNEQKDNLVQCENEIKLYQQTQNDYMTAVEMYKEASKKAEVLDVQYKNLRKAFMDEQAGILALELKENEPCPVCGSVHHPCPAKKSEKAPTEAELNQAEKLAVESQKNAEEKNRVCVEKKSSTENKLSKIGELWNKLSQTVVETISDDFINKVAEKKCSILNQIKEKQNELVAEEKKCARKEEIENRQPIVEKELQSCIAEMSNLKVNIASAEASQNAIKENIEKLKKNLRFESKTAAEQAVNALKKEIDNLKKALEKAQNDFTESTNTVTGLEAEIKQLKKQLDSAEKIDVKSAIEKDEKQKILKTELSGNLQKITSRLDRNKDALKSLKKSSGNLAEKEKRYTWISSLSKTANGNLSNGKEKIRLETYIQMNYFDRIITHANKRLMIMSDGQYELIRKKESDNHKSQTGLELDVIDHYNGGQRSVKSLSGGESFEASLALALGLSDEVRMSAGGIQLDSLFIDEGFGTLDSETLQKAFKALSSITDGNRIVGIISHVDLLKEKIDRQIIVKKERTGGSTVQINV